MNKAQILLVVATLPEIFPTIQAYKLSPTDSAHIWTSENITVLITGVGMTNTAYYLGKYLHEYSPNLAINAGIGGSFDKNIPLGTAVEIIEDTFSEMGAEDKNQFLTMEALGFPLYQTPDTIYYNTFLQPNPSSLPIPKTTAITVNTVHGETESINKCIMQWNKQIETMESAAFFQIMIAEKIPFLAFRGISNYVEPRNRENWKIKEAVLAVNEVINLFLP